MNAAKALQWAGLLLILALAGFAVASHLQYFSNLSILGGVFLVEVIIACIWKYKQRFFVLLMIVFLWSGMRLPLQSIWTSGRWVVLAVGAVAGCFAWFSAPRGPFRSFHLIALFCVGTAFVSATISPFPQMATFKALSLALLFLYCSLGIRAAVLGREERFLQGLLLGIEIVVYATFVCYFGLGQSIWGNPNSLGAAMSIGIFPVLFWGWLTANAPGLKLRRLIALLLCSYLIIFSMARAGIVSMILVTVVFCLCLHQYRLLGKIVGLVLLIVAVTGVFAPERLNKSLSNMKDAVLYKGHKDEGMLGSRLSPWQKSITAIKEHPWFGTGYGTSPTGEDPGLSFGKFSSTAETAREHGSSYMAITEWVGLLGVVPFLILLVITASNAWRILVWMSRTSSPFHYSIPLAMVVLAGLAHANFEDWLFAVGAYPCVYFWVFAFLLADLRPSAAIVSISPAIPRAATSLLPFRTAASNR